MSSRADRPYAQRTIDRYRCGLDYFSHWVNRDRTPWNGEEELVRRFLSSHRHVCDRLALSAALRHLLRFLRARGYVIAGNHGAARIEGEVLRFDTYLERVCGLASKTRKVRTHFIRRAQLPSISCRVRGTHGGADGRGAERCPLAGNLVTHRVE